MDEAVPLSEQKVISKSRPMKWSFSVWVSAVATVISISSCLLFSVLFNRALQGFSNQVNAFVSVGNFASTSLQLITFLLCSLFIVYLFVTYLSSARVFRGTSCLGSFCMLFISSFTSQAFLVAWVLLLCFVSSVSLVYFLFIGGIYSFCALLDQQCFDFKVLLPAILSRISNKKVDMVFCEEKKELLCSAANNQIWNFMLAFICAIVTFSGCLLIQNCLVFGLGKKKSKEERNTKENIEMDAF